MSSRKKALSSTVAVLGAEAGSGGTHRVLLAGLDDGAAEICEILEALPPKTRGRAFIEVATSADILPVAAPGGLTVSWLTRDARGPRPIGEVLDRAVRAWLSEMILTIEQAQNLSTWVAGEAGSLVGIRLLLAPERLPQA